MKKNTETYPTKKLSFYNFKPFTWNNNFILNFSFTFEFGGEFNDEISILDIKSSNNNLPVPPCSESCAPISTIFTGPLSC